MAYNSTIDKATDDILIYGNTAKDGSGTSYVPLLDADGQLQVDVIASGLPTGASTLAEQQSQTTHLATIAGDTTAIETAVQLIDDTVYTDGAGTVTKGIAILGQDGTNPQAIKTDASGELQVDVLTMPTVAVTQSGTWDEVGINDSGNSITVDNAGTFATQESQILADNAGFTDGTTKVFTSGYIYDEVAGTALTENDVAAARVNVNRSQIGIIEDGVTRGRYATVSAANALKVDASGVAVPITDNSGSITVDYATTGSGTATGALRVELPTNGTGTVGLNAGTNAIGKLAANSGVDIGDVDVLSVIAGTGATNLGKARDSAIGATDTGVAMLGVRRDAPTAETPAAGDYVVPQYSANGEAWVRLGGELADDTAFTVGTTRVVPAGLLADETATDSVDEGDIGISRMTLDRKAIVTPLPHSANGLTIHKTDALVATAVAVKASAGNLYGYHIYNPNTADIYVQFYNIAQGSTTVGTSTRSISLVVPAGGVLDGVFPLPVSFTTAITIAATTTLTGSSAPSTGLVTNLFYF